MASMQIRPNRQLRELLEEEQEPFILDAYLLERAEPSKVLNKSASCHLQGRVKKGVLYSSKLLKSAYNKLVLINKSLKINNCDGQVSDQAAGSERFSSASSSTVYNSCPESDKDEASTSLHCQDHTSSPWDNPKSCNHRKDEALTDSSVTTPEKTSPPTTCSCDKTKKRQEENPSLWGLLVCSTTEKLDFIHSSASSQLLKFKFQNQQLLFDCVRELIEESSRQILGSGELISDKIKEWGKQSSIDELLSLDFEESVDEWSDLKPQKRELAMAVGDDILEELRNQLVIDMLHSLISV